MFRACAAQDSLPEQQPRYTMLASVHETPNPVYLNLFNAMDSGLSSRMEKIVNQVDPTPLAQAPPLIQHHSTIDLSNAQNELIRPELLEMFKKVVQDGMSTDASALTKQRTLESL